METELKLRFATADDQKHFLESPWLDHLVLPESRVETDMLSRYFDTLSQTLTKMKTSLRIREEGEERVATIKLGAKSSNGLHQRLEWSVDLDENDWSSDLAQGLDAAWFGQNAFSEGDPDDCLQEILQAIDGQPLIEICQAKFVRIAFDVGYGDTLMELALDLGELIAGDMTDSIMELELELKEGDVRDLMELGDELKARFNLIPEEKSKYSRCLEMLAKQAALPDA